MDNANTIINLTYAAIACFLIGVGFGATYLAKRHDPKWSKRKLSTLVISGFAVLTVGIVCGIAALSA